MREFNLEQALAGAPVCTRDGRPVTQLVKFDCEYDRCVFGVMGGKPISWLESGRHLKSMESDADLFMAPTKKTGWVARLGPNIYYVIFPSEESAKECVPEALSYHQIEWEE